MSGTGRLPRLVRRWLSTGKARAVVRGGGRTDARRAMAGHSFAGGCVIADKSRKLEDCVLSLRPGKTSEQ
jgi:hypothetical protein